jgi:hypothetical protein
VNIIHVDADKFMEVKDRDICHEAPLATQPVCLINKLEPGTDHHIN